MKVTLIHPPVYINKNGLTALRPSLPLGLAYIAAVLRDDKHTITLIDALGAAPEKMVSDGDIWRLGLTPEEIIARIPADVQAIGITSMWSYSWPIVRELILKVKAAFPTVPIVCGGEHFTAVPELSMEQAPAGLPAPLRPLQFHPVARWPKSGHKLPPQPQVTRSAAPLRDLARGGPP